MFSKELLLLSFLLLGFTSAKKFKEEEKPAWAKKSILDYNDADVEHLLDQWEVCKISLSIYVDIL